MANIMNLPMYQRIKEDILHRIDSNLLLPGDRLPTERELMQQYHVSRITVSKALGELKKEGRVERFPNKGTFVSRIQSSPSPSGGIKLPEEPEAPFPRTGCLKLPASSLRLLICSPFP